MDRLLYDRDLYHEIVKVVYILSTLDYLAWMNNETSRIITICVLGIHFFIISVVCFCFFISGGFFCIYFEYFICLISHLQNISRILFPPQVILLFCKAMRLNWLWHILVYIFANSFRVITNINRCITVLHMKSCTAHYWIMVRGTWIFFDP